jgi:hypothetical protein
MAMTCYVYIAFQWEVNDNIVYTMLVNCTIIIEDSYLNLKYQYQIIFHIIISYFNIAKCAYIISYFVFLKI